MTDRGLRRTSPVMELPVPLEFVFCADGSAGVNPRRKAKYSCENCRSKKIKCDESRPACVPCAAKKIACKYGKMPGLAAKESKRLNGKMEPKKRRISSNSDSSESTTLPGIASLNFKPSKGPSESKLSALQGVGSSHGSLLPGAAPVPKKSPQVSAEAASIGQLAADAHEFALERRNFTQISTSTQFPSRSSLSMNLSVYDDLLLSIALHAPDIEDSTAPSRKSDDESNILETLLRRGPAVYLPLISAFVQHIHAFYPVFLSSPTSKIVDLLSTALSPARYTKSEGSLMCTILALGAEWILRYSPFERIGSLEEYRDKLIQLAYRWTGDGLSHSDLFGAQSLIYLSLYKIATMQIQVAYKLASAAYTQLRLCQLSPKNNQEKCITTLSLGSLFLLDSGIFASYSLPPILTYSDALYAEFSYSRSKYDITVLQFLNARISALALRCSVKESSKDWIPEKSLRVPGILFTVTGEFMEKLEEWRLDIPEVLRESNEKEENSTSETTVSGGSSENSTQYEGLPLQTFKTQLQLYYYDIRAEIGKLYLASVQYYESQWPASSRAESLAQFQSEDRDRLQIDPFVMDRMKESATSSLQDSRRYIKACASKPNERSQDLCSLMLDMPRLLSHLVCLTSSTEGTSQRVDSHRPHFTENRLQACARVQTYLASVIDNRQVRNQQSAAAVDSADDHRRYVVGKLSRAVDEIRSRFSEPAAAVVRYHCTNT
ncbi:hypothetical protein BZA70DRAFT_291447 [Myxozyma melibiosi]|uniref:Zn(2)-C6 fungal-type domain-containing protein n=1 Tax=Myxozyma melibiosi TaxID=54550 RepID=A0ABR1F0R2_9ASCO